jgi:NADH dehydrogenase
MGALDAGAQADERYELAGPDTLSHQQLVELAMRAQHRHRPIVHVPTPIVSRTLRVLEALMKSKAPATWDEAELLEVSLLSERGTADAERLGVAPRHMAAVLDAP